ncbi:MAG: DUF4038 domain-containing protein, partial [Bacteroidetes bacterium]|nr:DUF4038 domain-containing protein [Bacteroidota bacterium]
MKCKLIRFFISFFVVVISFFNCKAQVVFPLKSSPNGHYLVDQNSKPFPILGRTAWFIISQPVEGYKTFIANCVSHGCNSIEMHVLDHDPRGNHPPFNGNGDLPFQKCLDGSSWKGSLVYKDAKLEAPDLTVPNENYWRFVDTFLSYCASKGILIFFFPAYLGYDGGEQGWMQELIANGSDKTQTYGAWIANRYKNQKNLVWMFLGDMGNFTEKQKDAEAALIKGLKSIPHQQSIFYSAEANGGQNSRDQIDFGNEMTLNGVYSWDKNIPALGRKAYSQIPVMPSYLLEEPYDEEGPDGNSVNPNAIQPVRRFQWWGWLTTIGGYVAGNGYIWPFIEPRWEGHLNTPATVDMQKLNSFIKLYHWWELVPSGLDGMKTLIVSGGGEPSDSDYVAASATPSENLLIAYIPPAHRGSITVDMTAMKGKITARWYDPTSGDYKKVAGPPFANKGKREFTPPGKN